MLIDDEVRYLAKNSQEKKDFLSVLYLLGLDQDFWDIYLDNW